MIKITGLSSRYHGQQLLNQVDLSMAEGDFMALCGEDNAGKTTLLHILMGFRRNYEGTAYFYGKSAGRWTSKERALVRFVPDNILWEQKMTGRDYLQFAKAASPAYDEKQQEELCREWEIPVNRPLLSLTYQENKRIQIIAAACAKPKLLILDEPMNFLGKEGYRFLLEKLRIWNQQGMSILLAVQQYAHARGYCRNYAYMKEGRLVKESKVPQPDLRQKVITVRGGVPEAFRASMERSISSTRGQECFLYQADMCRLPSLLKLLDTDYIIEELTLEQEIEMDFSKWE